MYVADDSSTVVFLLFVSYCVTSGFSVILPLLAIESLANAGALPPMSGAETVAYLDAPGYTVAPQGLYWKSTSQTLALQGKSFDQFLPQTGSGP